MVVGSIVYHTYPTRLNVRNGIQNCKRNTTDTHTERMLC